MKRDGFFVLVLAFAIFSAFVLYTDYTSDCGSLICVTNYISTGETSSKNYDLGDSLFSKIVSPFVNPVVPENSEDILLQPAGTCREITQYGITWTFDTEYPCGQFVNGDWYVVGPLTITSKTPNPTDSPARHGDWIDPIFDSSLGQPFDDRIITQSPPPLGLFTGPNYEGHLRPVYPIFIDSNSYPTGASLVSTISQPEVTNCGSGEFVGWETFSDAPGTYETRCNAGPIKSTAVLTILFEEPTNGLYFRPPYVGGIDKRPQFSLDQINFGLLGTVDATPSLLAYSISDVNRHIQRPNLQLTYWPNQALVAGDNANGYGQFMANDIGLASLIVNVGDYSNSEKEPLVISLTQYGIDFNAVHQTGVYTDSFLGITYDHAPWYGLTGLGLGRLFPILFAGRVLENSEMSNVARDPPSSNSDYYFSEKDQTFLVENYAPQVSGYTITKDLLVHSNYCSGGGINCGYGGYDSSDIGLPEYGISHYTNPASDTSDWSVLAAPTRYTDTATTWNSYILASHIMGLVSDWNSPELFAYTDRYMESTDLTGPYLISEEIQSWMGGWYPAFRDMWDAYRGNYGVVWTQGNLCPVEGQLYSCPLQQGVCAGATDICTMRNGCDASVYLANNPNYQVSETNIADGLDNDCDGLIDEQVPNVPSSLTVLPTASDSLQISWVDVSDEQGYTLEYKLSTDSVWQSVNLGVDVSSYLHTGLTPNTFYDYRILSYNALGSSAFSSVVSGRTLHLTPIVSSINPLQVYSGQDTTVTVSGSNFVPEFAIIIRVVGTTNWIPWCDFISNPTTCVFVDPNTITFEVSSASSIPGDYEFAYVNLYGVTSGSGPIILSNAYPLTVVQPPVLTGVNPNSIRHNIERTVTLSGSNLDSEFVLVGRVAGTTSEVIYCSFLDTQLYNWVDGNTLLVDIPQGFPAENYEFSYYNLNPSPVNSNWLSLTVEATTCLDGVQTQPCSNQNGACAGAVSQCVDGEFVACTASNYESNNAAYNLNEIGLCSDGVNNDCDASGEFDYVGSGNGIIKGDSDCAIRINSVNVPLTAVVGSNLNLVCSTDVSNVAVAVDGSLNGVFCPQASSSGNNANFNCLVSGTPGTTQTAGCFIDTNIAYDSGSPIESNPVQILASSCSGYSSSTTCESDNNCDWVLGCFNGVGPQSSGAGDRCVSAGSGTYSCISGQCGATWTTGNVCASDQISDTNSCSCISQSPSISNINGVSSLVLSWSSDNFVNINGQYFASNSQVLLDGLAITNSLIITPNSISFPINAEEFSIGTHSITVLNPTSGLSSNSVSLIFDSSPTITSIVPNLIYNNVANLVTINGFDFDPGYFLLANGVDFTYLSSYVNSGQIQVLIPAIALSGQLNVVVVSGDGASSSNPSILTWNYPFDYIMDVNPSTVTVASGYSFDAQISLLTYVDMTQEEIVVTVPNTPEATVTFIGSDRCTPSGAGTTPVCTVDIHVELGTISEQDYVLNINAVSQVTGVAHQIPINLEGVVGTLADCTNGVQDTHETCLNGGGPICGPAGFLCNFGESCLLNNDCQVNPSCSPPVGLCYSSMAFPNPICSPDQDCDSVPDSIDTCPSTPAGTTVSPLNGCPLPIATEFTSSSTTNFLSVFNLNSVDGLNLGISGVGSVQFIEPVSVLRLVSGVHQALNLDNAIDISNNLVRVNSVNNPELNKLAVVTLEGLTYSDVTPMVLSGTQQVVCPATQCDDLTYSGGVFTMRVSGFSEYSAAQASCGDSYCSLLESQATCPSDCGSPPSATSGGSSGGSGGGGGGGGGGSSGGVRPSVTQCNDKIDNDGDGKVDYPADAGCFNSLDNSELDENPLIDNTNEEQSSNTETPLENVLEVRVIFWTVLVALIGGIVFISTIILRDLLGRKKFNDLAKIVPSSTVQNS